MSLPTNFFIGRGGASEKPAITGNNLTNIVSYTGASGTVYYRANQTANSSLEIVSGGTFFVAMVGAGGAGGRQGYGGSGGLGIAKIELPSVDAAGNALARLFFLRGQGGSWQAITGASGGSENGGRAGNYTGASGSYYNNDTGGSGGGVVGIQAGQLSGSRELTHSGNNLHLAYVGSGGGGAHQETNNRSGGNGGGIHRDGHYVPYSFLGSTEAQGGTRTAGGAQASQPNYNPQNTASDGAALSGGRGHDSDYDGSGGGGAGWFGGGGGKGGGGYDGGGGGGGSGYAHPSYTTVLYQAEQDTNPGQALTTNLAIHTSDSASFFENTVGIAATAGNGGSIKTNGGNSEIIVWNGT